MPGGRASFNDDRDMFGLIGRMTAVEGRREELIEILLGGTGSMPGCRSYIIARDTEDSDSLWITEVWESKAHHAESLHLPEVKDAISRGKPLIREFSHQTHTEPVGGYGLS